VLLRQAKAGSGNNWSEIAQPTPWGRGLRAHDGGKERNVGGERPDPRVPAW